MSEWNERCEKRSPTPGFTTCKRPLGHPGACDYWAELTLAEILELRGDAVLEVDATGKPRALVLGGAAPGAAGRQGTGGTNTP